MNKKQNLVVNIAQNIIGTYYKNQCFDKVLIAGCGSTDNETIAISKAIGAKKTLGIDINIENRIIDSKIELQKQDLTQLDIDAGNKVACTTIHVDYGYNEKLRKKPDFRVKYIHEVTDIILNPIFL